LSDKNIKAGQILGKEIEYIRDNIYFKSRLYFASHRLYQFIVAYPGGTQATPAMQTFLESVKLSPPNMTTTNTTTQLTLSPTAKSATIADPVEITLDPAVAAAIEKNISGVKDLKVQLFVSDDQPEHLATTTEASILQSGYKFAITGGTTFVKDGTAYSGGYSKLDTPDILLTE
jgi:hypothetical protein